MLKQKKNVKRTTWVKTGLKTACLMILCLNLAGCSNILKKNDFATHVDEQKALRQVSQNSQAMEDDTDLDILMDEDTENDAVSPSSSSNTIAAIDRTNDGYLTGYKRANIPEYSEDGYIYVNDNVPFFTDEDMTTDAFENYSDMDDLGRCGVAYANICKEIMPTEERGEIGMIKPSGWNQAKYPEFIEGAGYLYNRCHLIGYQLAGENDNKQNLITGTRAFNLQMLPFENMVDDYVEETGNHVLYRVTPVFEGDELVARGVLMEAKSVEDDKLSFCVFVYNVQNGLNIDYTNGKSELAAN